MKFFRRDWSWTDILREIHHSICIPTHFIFVPFHSIHVKIRRVSNRYRNPSDQPQDSEIQILEAYEYNAENGIESEPNIQKLENGEVLLYTKPIIISSSLCLNCHGKPGLEIDKATLKAIDSKYPNDRAKDHNMKDLRGMWSVMIPKKEVVKKM